MWEGYKKAKYWKENIIKLKEKKTFNNKIFEKKHIKFFFIKKAKEIKKKVNFGL